MNAINNGKIVVCGALSAIAQAVCRELCAGKPEFFLIGRDATRLRSVADDLLARGATKCHVLDGDLVDGQFINRAVTASEEVLEGSSLFLLCYGALPNQAECERDPQKMHESLTVNFTSVTHWLELIAEKYEARRSGAIAVISSVAGDRGRQSNYIYGAAKGGLSIYLQGLRNRLFRSNVAVLTVKPGFVDTPMTAAVKKGALFASPAQVATDIVRAIQRRNNELYTPWFWRWIMLVIRNIPEEIFKRLKL